MTDGALKPFSSLSPREQDAALAEAAGLEVLPFTVSLDAMRVVEEVVRSQQKEGSYCRVLADVVQFDWRAYEDHGSQEFEPLIYATSTQRAEAAWRVLGGQ